MDLIPIQKDIVELIQAGADGFLLKDATINDFLKTIRDVSAGNKILPPNLTDSLFSQIVEYAIKKDDNSLIKSSVHCRIDIPYFPS